MTAWKSLTSEARNPAFQRSRDGKAWEDCTTNDVRLAVGWTGVREVKCGNTVTSEHGVKYRKKP